MKLKRNKLVLIFLVFSFLFLSVNLYAKKRGADLIVTKKDGQQVQGELITVKPNSLLLLNTEGKDVSINIADIKVIRVVKKSKALLGAGIGFGAGALLGPLLASVIFHAWHEEYDGPGVLLIEIPVGSAIGALIGAIIGSSTGKDETIQIERMSDFHEFRETLDYLRKKARIRDYK